MIFHRGREMAHQEVGRAKMTRLLGEIGEQGQIETRRAWKVILVALLAPKRAPRARPQRLAGSAARLAREISPA
jgi:translation initiation factor IF-3